jgi:hypothetical protein
VGRQEYNLNDIIPIRETKSVEIFKVYHGAPNYGSMYLDPLSFPGLGSANIAQ